MDEREERDPGQYWTEDPELQAMGYGPQFQLTEINLGDEVTTPWPRIRGRVLWRTEKTVWIEGRDRREYALPYRLVNPRPFFFRGGTVFGRVKLGEVSWINARWVQGNGIELRTPDGMMLGEADIVSLLESALARVRQTGPQAVVNHNWQVWREQNPEPAPLPMPKYGAKRPGVVYLLRAENGLYKIGRARWLHGRITQLEIQVPMEISLEWHIECDDAVKAEAFLHERFAGVRVRGEWFRLSPEEVGWFKSIAVWEDGELRFD